MTLVLLSPLMLLLLPLALLPFAKQKPTALPISSLAPYAGLPAGWREKVAKVQPLVAFLCLVFVIIALAEPT